MTYNVTVASSTNEYGTGNKYYITSLSSSPSPILRLTDQGVLTNLCTNGGHPLASLRRPMGRTQGSEYTTGVAVASPVKVELLLVSRLRLERRRYTIIVVYIRVWADGLYTKCIKVACNLKEIDMAREKRKPPAKRGFFLG